METGDKFTKFVWFYLTFGKVELYEHKNIRNLIRKFVQYRVILCKLHDFRAYIYIFKPNFSDSSKRKSSMQLKCSKEKSELVSSVEALNTVSRLLALPPINAKDILERIFPSSFSEESTSSQGYTFWSFNFTNYFLESIQLTR